MHTYLLQKLDSLEKKTGKIVKPITGKPGPKKGNLEKMIAAVKTEGWNVEGANVTGNQLKSIFKLIEGYEKINTRFSNWKNNSEIGKRNAFKQLAELVYQYN